MRGDRSVVAGRERRGQYRLAGTMGLLDDAIREHMELKRLRGGDPTVIAQQEHDALGPVPREEDVAAPHDGAPHAEGTTPHDAAPHAEGALRQAPDDDSSEPQQPDQDPDFAN